jgi:hypothetical protein
MVAILSGTICAAEDVLSAIPEGVERYARDIDAVIKSPGRVSLEPVFDEGLSVAEVLGNQLERFDEPTYRKVQSMMVGFLVFREEVVGVAPDADFFLKLAREKGTSVDLAFFDALKKTYPDGYWPAYNERQTDYSGCTIFDGKTLTELYGAWMAFQTSFPDHYREAARQQLAQIEEALGSPCACGGEEGVQKEFEGFLKAYPSSPMAATVASRLQAVRNHTSGIRFYCKTG